MDFTRLSEETSVLTFLNRKLFGALALGTLAAAATLNAAAPLPAETYTKAIEADVAHLNALIETAKANKAKKGLPGIAKATALVIASYAQDNLEGKDGAKMAALRAGAIKVSDAIGKKDLDAAAKAAEALKTVAADAAADKKPVKLASANKLDLHDLMHLFGRTAGGGMNIEADIRDIKKTGVKDVKMVELIGARTAAIAEFSLQVPPDFGGKKTKMAWDSWSKEMKDLSVELSTEAAKGAKSDAAKLKKLITSLDANCTNCHNTFRDD